MSNQALSDEQISTLRFIAEHPLLIEEDSDNFYSADYLNVCGYVDISDGSWKINYAGRVLLSTLDHHTTKAKEDERRRIDELATELAKHWTHEFLFAAKEDRWEIASGGSDLDILGVGESFTACLEAATRRESDAA